MRFVYFFRARWSLLRLAVAGLSAAVLLSGAERAPLKLPEFEFLAPMPALAAAGAKAGIALDGIASSAAQPEAGRLAVDDRVAVLVSLTKGGARSQWLVELRCVELNEQEKKLPPLKVQNFYTNAGTEGVLGTPRAALQVQVLGPFTPESGKGSRHEQGRILVNADYLGLGLDRGSASVMSVNAAKLRDPTLKGFAWSVRLKPFPPEEVAEGRKLAAALGMTPDMERAVFGANPALREFFRMISETPGLQDILKEVIDIPWWTLIKQGGKAPVVVAPQFYLADEMSGESFHLGARKAYMLPYQVFIGGKPALVGKLAVTAAQPPLLTCAGIAGVTAWAPDGTGPRVMLQVVSAQRGVRTDAAQ